MFRALECHTVVLNIYNYAHCVLSPGAPDKGVCCSDSHVIYTERSQFSWPTIRAMTRPRPKRAIQRIGVASPEHVLAAIIN